METSDLKEKLVAVLGYGVEGKAVTAYLLKHGVKPVLFDQRPWELWSEIEKQEIKKLGINFIFGPDAFKELIGFNIAFRSPGIKISELKTHNLELTSQVKWFFDHCPAKIIGVTGTKGKGTTCSLIYEILQANNRHPLLLTNNYLTGNIGKTQPLNILDSLKREDCVVYELSSFQLQDLQKSPHISVVLMVTSEHLDYHTSVEEYVAAKSAITKYQTANDVTVINADFPSSQDIGKFGQGQKRYFSTEHEADCFTADGVIYLQTQKADDNKILKKITDWQLRGKHNEQNICAAALAAHSAGCNFEAIKKAIQDFKGLEHRLEFVAEAQGVKYYNDSFSTTPETAIAAVNSFAEPEIVILGGSTKNSDFSKLGKAIVGRQNIKSVLLIGQEALRIKQAIESAGSFRGEIIEGATSMADIFDKIKLVTKKGDVVLLSPACASFDMFKSYADRGNQFKAKVLELTNG